MRGAGGGDEDDDEEDDDEDNDDAAASAAEAAAWALFSSSRALALACCKLMARSISPASSATSRWADKVLISSRSAATCFFLIAKSAMAMSSFSLALRASSRCFS